MSYCIVLHYIACIIIPACYCLTCSRLTTDVQDFKSSFKMCVSIGLRSITQVVGGVVSLFLISPQMASVMALGLPLMIGIGSLMGSGLRVLSRKAQEQVCHGTTLLLCASQISVLLLAFTHAHTQTQIHTRHTQTQIHTRTCTQTHRHMYTNAHIHTHVQLHACIHNHMNTYVHSHTHSHTHTHTNTHSCAHTHTHTHMHAHTHTHTHIHACTRTHS